MLKGGHSAPVSVLAYSPNGRYLASAASDGSLTTWDLTTGDTVGSAEVEADTHVMSIAWNPTANVLYLFLSSGHVAKWSTPVPSHMSAPFDATVASSSTATATSTSSSKPAPASPSKKPSILDYVGGGAGAGAKVGAKTEAKEIDPFGSPVKGRSGGGSNIDALMGADDDGSDAGNGSGGDNDDDGDDSDGGGRRGKLQRLRNSSSDVSQGRGNKKSSSSSSLSSSSTSTTGGAELAGFAVNMQPAFQPGATPVSRRWFHAWNLVGSVEAVDQEGFHNSITVMFSDASRKRVTFNDRYGFMQCALGTHGAFFGAPGTSVRDLSWPSALLLLLLLLLLFFFCVTSQNVCSPNVHKP